MEKAEAILNHTLEMICLMTVEDYIVVKREVDGDKPSYCLCTATIPDSSAVGAELSFTLLGIQDRNQKKILELADKIIRLLTCEVPLKYQDVAVYFTKEEWEYLEGHGEYYNYKRMDEAKEDLLPANYLDTDQRSPVHHHIKMEPDTGDVQDQPAVSVRRISACCVKLEPRTDSDEDAMDGIHTDPPKLLSSVTSYISEKPDEAYNTRLSAVDNNFIDNQTVQSEIIYQITVTDERCQKSKSGGRTGPCDLCGKRFGNKASLIRHMKVHTRERPFPCDTCEKKFSCKNHLTSHQRIHTGEKPFSCAECGRKFTNQSHLVLHKVVHTKEKPFTCPVCGKGFTRKSSVVKHSGIHAEKKPYVCKECSKSYCQYANLVVHQRLHSGEKPFTCRHCQQGFISKARMKRHELTHTGERPFACPQCDKSFTDNSSLNKHKRGVHAKKS